MEDFIDNIITIGGFLAVIWKFTDPINKLNLAIQELRDYMKQERETNDRQNKLLDEHGKAIDNLNVAFKGLETKVGMYHRHE